MSAAAPRPPEAAPPVVELRGLVVRYGDAVAVDGADLAVPAAGITALVGPSGCGKTSLLRTIAGFEAPRAGAVYLAGRCVAGRGDDGAEHWVAPEKRRVGMVFQEGALFPHLTVEGNVLYGLARGGDAGERRRRARRALERVGMEGLAGRYPDELSGGQQQRVALARALAPRPALVLLDEPFASLDAGLRVRLRDEVRQILAAAGATAVLVTHDQEEALSVADTVAVMTEGRVRQVGSPHEVYHRPASPRVARFLGDGQLVPCHLAGGRLRSVFGELPAGPALGDGGAAPGDGDGLLLVRPEDLAVMPPGYAHGPAGRVVRRRFFGHDLVDDVVLEDDAALELGLDSALEPGGGDVSVQVRLLASTPHPVGSRVRLVLRAKEFQLFTDGGASTVRLTHG